MIRLLGWLQRWTSAVEPPSDPGISFGLLGEHGSTIGTLELRGTSAISLDPLGSGDGHLEIR